MKEQGQLSHLQVTVNLEGWQASDLCGVEQVSLKGARALVKVFTDLQASLEDVQSWFSVGLEPIIGLVSTHTSCNLLSPGPTVSRQHGLFARTYRALSGV